MNRIINIATLWLATGCALFSGCNDFLKEEGLPRLTVDFYGGPQGIETAITAVYSYMRWGATSERYDAMTEFGTDLVSGTYEGQRAAVFDDYGIGLNPSNSQITSMWSNHYKAISTANLAIALIEESETINELDKPKSIAEMSFMRAYYYFDLVQHFGRIPLVLEASFEPRTDFPRASVADIYNQMIIDLKYAVKYLPEKPEASGKGCKYAAAHLLAKVFLARGSAVTEQRGQQPTDMEDALEYAEMVIDSHNYELVDNFSDLFDFDNQDNSEVIFAVQFTKDPLYNGDGNSMHLYWVPNYPDFNGMVRDTENGRPYRRFIATKKAMWDLFDRKNDSRFHKSFKWVFYCNTPYENGGVKLEKGDTAIYYSIHPKPVDATYTYAYVQYDANDPYSQAMRQFSTPLLKHLDPDRITMNETAGSRNWVRMRLGETYLIAAEAAGRANDFETAAKYINEVRKRAAWKQGEKKYSQYWREEGGEYGNTDSTYPEIEVDEDDLRSNFVDFILDERGRELFGELYRWEDLVRCEKLAEYVQFNGRAKIAFREHHKLRPIPQDHIDRLNPKGSLAEEQNEGYY